MHRRCIFCGHEAHPGFFKKNKDGYPICGDSADCFERKEAKDAQLTQEAKDWDTGKTKPTDPGWILAQFYNQIAVMPRHGNWDSYGGKPTTDAAKEAVVTWGAKLPDDHPPVYLYPYNHGGIQAEWMGDNAEEFEIVFGPDGTLETEEEDTEDTA